MSIDSKWQYFHKNKDRIIKEKKKQAYNFFTIFIYKQITINFS